MVVHRAALPNAFRRKKATAWQKEEECGVGREDGVEAAKGLFSLVR